MAGRSRHHGKGPRHHKDKGSNGHGSNGNDVIVGTEGDDRLYGGRGDDVISGGGGDDRIDGGSGNNVIDAGSGNDRVKVGDGNNVIATGDGNDRVQAGDGDNVIDTGDGNDSVRVDDGDNVIDTGNGNDCVRADDGDNVIHTGSGRDRVFAGDGDNVIVTGDGDDVVIVGDGDNIIDTGDGNDIIIADDGDNTIDAGSGNDIVIVDNGHNVIDAGDGNDFVHVGNGGNVIDGGAGNDILLGGRGDDTVTGGAGNDYVDADKGDDTAIYELQRNLQSVDFYDGGRGSDTLQIDLTYGEAEEQAIQDDLDAFEDFLDDNANPHDQGWHGSTFHFSFADLSVRNFETLDVNLINTGPEAHDDAAATDEDTATLIDVLGNDVDADHLDRLNLDSVSVVSGLGTASVVNGQILYDPTAYQFLNDGETASVELSYTISDIAGAQSTATVIVTVTGQTDNLPPIAVADTATGIEDQAQTILAADLLANDSDPENQALTLVSVGNAVGGSVALDVNGDVTFMPDPDFNGQATFDYTVADVLGATSTATVTVDVAAVNDGPVANDDSAATTENAAILIDVLANDTDVDAGDNPSTFTIVSASIQGAAGQGSVSIVGNQLAFDPGADFDFLATGETANVVIDYTMADSAGAPSAATATIAVTGTNDAPVVGLADTSATITEAAAGSPGENAATHTANGAIAFTDLDLSDAHGVTVTPAGGGAGFRGTFDASLSDASTGDGAGAVAWTFAVADTALNDLEAGETLTQAYTVTIDDGHGGSESRVVTVTINGSADISLAGETIVGRTGVGALTIDAAVTPFGDTFLTGTAAAGSLTTDGIIIGEQAGSSGDMIVDGGALQTDIDGIIVGNSGAGSLLVDNGGFVSVDAGTDPATFFVARFNGSTGDVTVQGGSNLAFDGGEESIFAIGYNGNGSTGGMTVTGAGSVADLDMGANSSFYVGHWGDGTLSVTDGADFSVDTGGGELFANIGSRTGSNGTVTVDAANMALGGALNVGLDGSGSLDISNGGSFTAIASATAPSDIRLGDSLTGNGSVSVDGAGTTFTYDTSNRATDDLSLIVGNRGSGSLSITDGATATVEAFLLAAAEASGQGDITVDGAGSTLQVQDDIFAVASRGDGTLTVSDGASVIVDNGVTDVNSIGTFNDFTVADTSTATGNATITGAGSTLSVRGLDNVIKVGQGGGTGTLNVLDGAFAESLWLEIGQNQGNGTVNVDGVGSLIRISPETGSWRSPYSGEAGFLNVGRGSNSSGELNVTGGGRVEIRDGITQNTDTTLPGANIGVAGASGIVTVDGAGSAIEISQSTPVSIYNGAYTIVGYNGDGRLEVSNGGSYGIASQGAYFAAVAFSGGNAEVDINSGGSLTVDGLGGAATMEVSIGGNVGDSGLVTVSGEGSTLTLAGDTANLEVGRGGTILVENGADAAVLGGTAGLDYVWLGADYTGGITGQGSVLVDGAGSSFTMETAGVYFSDASSDVSGLLAATNGGLVTMTAPDGVYFDGASSMIAATGGIIDITGDLYDFDGGHESLISVDLASGFSVSGDATLSNTRLDLELGDAGASQVSAGGAAEIVSGLVHFDYTGATGITAGDVIQFVSAGGGAILDTNQTSLAVTGLSSSFSGSLSADASGMSLTATGSASADANTTLLFGSSRDDVFASGDGDDVLIGGGGSDSVGGGAGSDIFVYQSVSESGAGIANRDTITDFDAGGAGTAIDLIDISALSQGVFSFIGESAFSVDAGNTHARFDNVTKVLQIDADGDATVDMEIELQNVDVANLGDDDFTTV